MAIHQQNQSFTTFIFPLDPQSPVLPQFSELPSFYERGPRYKAYSDLRESKLRSKRTHQEQEDDYLDPSILTPKKEVKFQRNLTSALPKRSKGSSILAQSVPDFSAMIRKENRKPSSPLPPTPPSGLKNGRGGGVVGKIGGSKSVNNSGEKRGGSMMARKSYASIEELKGLGSIARSGINGENNKVGVTTRASSRNNILRSSRQF